MNRVHLLSVMAVLASWMNFAAAQSGTLPSQLPMIVEQPTIIGFQADPITGNPITDASGNPLLVYGPAKTVSGFRLKDGRASYGVGLETFLLGFPIHFDWSWRTLFNKDWEDVIFAGNGGSSAFRKARFAVWIGYDF